MKSFIIPKNSYGDQMYIRQISDTVNNYALSAGAAQVAVVPTSGQFVVFGADSNFFAKPNAAGSQISAAGVTNGGGSELNPASWCLQDVTGIALFAEDDTNVSLAYYRI